MGLHHKLCHTLGGTFGLPHAETHAVLLAHALDYNLPCAPEAHCTLIRLFTDLDPARALAEFISRLGLPKTLSALGMPEEAIERVADLTVSKPYPNPRPLDRGAIRNLLAQAWADGFPLKRSMKDTNARL